MKLRLIVPTIILTLAACTHETAIPLGNDMMEIDTSVATVYGRAGAQRIGMDKAAKSTLAMGYDKFIVVNNNGWNDVTINSFSQGTANTQGFAQQSSGSDTQRHPEAKIIIHMFHNGDLGSEKAVDAKAYLEMQ